MKARDLVLIIAVVVLFCMSVYADAGNADDHWKTALQGRWVREGGDRSGCYCGECIEVDLTKDVPFCVESNQIYVSAFYKLNRSSKALELFFREPIDVGAGGAKLPWKKFDRRVPLATIDLSEVQKGAVTLTWIGFRNAAHPAKSYTFGDSYGGVYHKMR